MEIENQINKSDPQMLAGSDPKMIPQIEKSFTYHPPKGDQPKKYEDIREYAKDFAYLIEALCPNSREKSLALTNLDQVVMWANAAIARNE